MSTIVSILNKHLHENEDRGNFRFERLSKRALMSLALTHGVHLSMDMTKEQMRVKLRKFLVPETGRRR